MAEENTPPNTPPEVDVNSQAFKDAVKAAVDAQLKATQSDPNSQEFKDAVQAAVDVQLRDAKDALNKAYEARDAANAKVKELEQKIRDDEIARLKEEGKHQEALEKELEDSRAEREALKKKNIELTRDIELRNALAAHPFRNGNATDMAYREIVQNLVQDENGVWVTRDGKTISDAVNSFISDEDNAFLLKAKQNSGTGSPPPKTPGDTPLNGKSIFELSQAEVLKLAQEGKLPKRK